jgi:pilus assembly protein CpaF
MFVVIVSEKGGSAERHEFQQNEVTIGRVQGNDIILGKGNVSKRHSRLVLKDGRFIVVDLKSTNGTYVNGRKVTSPLVVKPGDKIYIGDFTLTVEGAPGTQSGHPIRGSASDVSAPVAPVTSAAVPANNSPIDGVASEPAIIAPATGASPPMPFAQSTLPVGAQAPVKPKTSSAPPRTAESPRPSPKTWEPPVRSESSSVSRSAPARFQESGGTRGATKHTSAFESAANVIGDRNLRAVMARLESDLDIYDSSSESMQDDSRWTEAERAAERAVRQLAAEGQIDDPDQGALAAAAVREAVGLGVLESLLADERVREILVSSPSHVTVDYGQGAEPAVGAFSDGRMLATVLRRLASQAGVDLNRVGRSYEFVLPSGPHVTVVMPPLALAGPIVEIRRVHASVTLDELVASHAVSTESRAAIVRAVHSRRTIAVVGPSGSGVTTFLAAIAGVMPIEDRVIVATSIADLRVDRANLVTLVAGVGEGATRFAEVITHAARLRSDRLVIDGLGHEEIRIALAKLAGRTGGDVIGVRARSGLSPLDTLRRLLEMGGTPAPEAEILLAESIGVVVELDADHGLRRVRRVTELRVGPSGNLESGEAPS